MSKSQRVIMFLLALCLLLTEARAYRAEHKLRTLTSAQEKKPDLSFINNTSSNIKVMLAKGPTVEIVYIDNLKESNERRGLIRVRDKDDKIMVEVDDKGAATYYNGYQGNDAAKTFWKALANYYPAVCKTEGVR